MDTLDHAFVLLFALLLPVITWLEYRNTSHDELDNGPTRLELYKKTLLMQWSLCFAALGLWVFEARSFTLLGLGSPSFSEGSFLVSAGVVGLIIAALLYQNYSAKSASEDELNKLKQTLSPLKFVLPHTQGELRWCTGLAFTAGIVEEILWRGFLIIYLQTYLPLWAALGLSVLLFGLAHCYQGLRQLPGVLFVGGLLTALFYFSGSLWLSILCHISIDLLQARLAHFVLKKQA
jgi:membrane protease YdiL (CAAX protease family)